MIRVLHVLGGLKRAGAETMVMNLYRSIDRTKVQFDFVVHTDIDSEEYGAYRDEIYRLGGKIYVFPPFTGKNIFQSRKHWEDFFTEHTEYKILHSHIRSYASLYLPIAKKHGVITIIHSHSTSNGKGISSCIKRILQLPLRFQADWYFSCSKEAGLWLFGKKIVCGNRYHMVKNAIDTLQYSYCNKTRTQYREMFGANESTRVFVHVGRFHEAKNHMFLLDVFAQYMETNKNALLVLAGDGELRDVIVDKIIDLQITDKVLLLGNRADVPNILQAADCFLFPSRWEGLPVTVVEAQAAGIPCLVSNHVTKDVNVSSLISYLSICDGTDVWTSAILNLDWERKNVMADIVKNGFDISDSAKWITEFYRGQINE